MGTAAAGIAILTGVLAFFLGHRLISFLNWGLASFSFFTLVIGSLITTILQIKAVDLVNEHGSDVGISAYKGMKFLVLSWVAVALMGVAVMAWAVEFCIHRRSKMREYTEKVVSKGGWLRRKKSTESSVESKA